MAVPRAAYAPTLFGWCCGQQSREARWAGQHRALTTSTAAAAGSHSAYEKLKVGGAA